MAILLGGFRTTIPAYASTYHGQEEKGGLDSPEAFGDYAVACKERGFSGFKIHGWHDGDARREARTVLDMGGQDCKAIRCDAQGRLGDFAMNDKCAAGTGALLEEMAARLDIPLEEMNGLASQSENMVKLGSFCTVFSATEVPAATPVACSGLRAREKCGLAGRKTDAMMARRFAPSLVPLLILALLLTRRRILRLEETEKDEQGRETMILYCPRNENEYSVAAVMPTAERVKEIQEELASLLFAK